MPRIGRRAPGGGIYHVLNRGNGRCRLFHKAADYAAFIKLLVEVQKAVPVRILAWCLMPNHWHLVLSPPEDGQLSRFMLRLTTAHVRRRYAHIHDRSGGHLYQGRFKSFPVQDDLHFLTLCRYVESNALRANLVSRAERWPWSSLWVVEGGASDLQPALWPLKRPHNWRQMVNVGLEELELAALQTSLHRGRPYGSEAWVSRVVKQMGLEFTIRPRGRPKKEEMTKK